MTVFTPAPGAAPLPRMVAAQATLETRTLLRNGEQLLLTLVIPLLLLVAFGLEPLVNLGTGMSRIDFLTPGIIALAVMSTAFARPSPPGSSAGTACSSGSAPLPCRAAA
jgi:ABC-2 type transport system permease protein